MRRVFLTAATAAMVVSGTGISVAEGYGNDGAGCTTRFEQVPASPAAAIWYVEVEECTSSGSGAVVPPVPAPTAARPGARPGVKPGSTSKAVVKPKPGKTASSKWGSMVPGKVRIPWTSATSSTVRHTGVLPRTTHISGSAPTTSSTGGSVLMNPSPAAPSPGMSPVPGRNGIVGDRMIVAPTKLADTGSRLWLGAGMGGVLIAAGIGAALVSRRRKSITMY